MLNWRPDIVITGHTDAIGTDDAYFKLIDDCTGTYERIHRQAMVLDDDQPHLNIDSWGGWIWPYRTYLPQPQTFQVKVTVRNPHPRPASLTLRLVGPAGWQGEQSTLPAGPRAEVSCQLSMTPGAPDTVSRECHRQPIALELTADDQHFGQVAEAQVTIGCDEY